MIGKKIILGVASVWDARKGLNDLVSVSDINTSVLIVGLSESQKKSLPSAIIGIPRTNSVEALRKLYAVADVLFNPTYEDNFPTVNIEALCCGTPVVTYRTGGSPESIGTCGFSAQKGDIAEAAHLLKKVTAAEKSCVDQGKCFCLDAMLRQYMLHYLKLEP